MTTRTTGRHRSPVRTRTPLDVIGEAVSDGASSVGRRSAVIAASSGLLVTMGLPAVATPLFHAEPDAATTTSAAGDAAAPAPAATAAASTASASLLRDRATARARAAATAATAAAADTAGRAATRIAADSDAADAADAAARADAAAKAAADKKAADKKAADKAAADAVAARRASVSRAAARTAGETPSATTATGSGASGGSAASDDGDDGGDTADGGGHASAPAGSAAVVDVAKRYTGVYYRYGGTTPAGFDCSGFVQYVYGTLGVSLPRTAEAQRQAGTRVSRADAQAGDIVSFIGKGGAYHNGIYLGGGMMIDSPRTGKSIGVHAVWSSSVQFTRVT